MSIIEANPAETVAVKRRETQGIRVDAESRRLTRKESAVLAVLMNPENAQKTDLERMAIAGVSSSTWYEVVRDPFIARKQRELAQEFVRAAVAPMLKQSIDVATSERRDGFNDRKLLLEMGGFYVPKQQIDHTTAGQPIIGVVGVSMDEL